MRATAFISLTLALLAVDSGAMATPIHSRGGKQSAADPTTAIPWTKGNRPAGTSNPTSAPQGSKDPDGLVVVEDRAYAPSGRAVPASKARESSTVQQTSLPASVWHADAGSTLRATVSAWAKRAGWLVRWDSSVDYPIVAPLEFRGSYVHAMTQLIQSYAHADTPLHAALYTDQHLIRVTENQ